MRIASPALLQIGWLGFLALIAAAPTSRPATAPSSSPAGPAGAPGATLEHGRIHFIPPAKWTVQVKAANEQAVHYRSPDGKALIQFAVIEQKIAMPDKVAQEVGEGVCKSIRDRAKSSGTEIISEPTVKDDKRFFAKVVARTSKNGQADDRMYLYRQEGLTMLTIVSEAHASPTDAAAFHKLAEDMLLGVTIEGSNAAGPAPDQSAPDKSAPDKSAQDNSKDTGAKVAAKPGADAPGPTVLPKAHLKIESPPTGWRSQKSEAASGMVVTYRELGGENGLIIVSVRPLPPEAKNDPKLRDILIDEMMSGEQTSFQIPRSKVAEKSHAVPDAKFLRKTITKYDVQGEIYQIVSRQLMVGDRLISVASLASDERANAINALADAVATSAKQLGR